MIVKDICPYSEEIAASLARVFTKLGIPSLGPQVGIGILRVVERLTEVQKDANMTPNMIQVLENHRQRLLDICAVDAHHQKNVIDLLESVVKKGLNGKGDEA